MIQCCSDYGCDGGNCTNCSAISCTSTPDCCLGYACSYKRDGTGLSCCGLSKTKCVTNDDCCRELECTARGTCSAGLFGPCTTESDCNSDLLCVEYTCCIPENRYCLMTSLNPCCFGFVCQSNDGNEYTCHKNGAFSRFRRKQGSSLPVMKGLVMVHVLLVALELLGWFFYPNVITQRPIMAFQLNCLKTQYINIDTVDRWIRIIICRCPWCL